MLGYQAGAEACQSMRDSRVHSPDAALVLEEPNRHPWRYFSQNTQIIKTQKTQNGTK